MDIGPRSFHLLKVLQFHYKFRIKIDQISHFIENMLRGDLFDTKYIMYQDILILKQEILTLKRKKRKHTI